MFRERHISDLALLGGDALSPKLRKLDIGCEWLSLVFSFFLFAFLKPFLFSVVNMTGIPSQAAVSPLQSVTTLNLACQNHYGNSEGDVSSFCSSRPSVQASRLQRER